MANALQVSNNQALASIPVAKKTFDTYCTYDAVFGSMEFLPMADSIGENTILIVNRSTVADSAEVRDFNTDYSTVDSETTPETYYLKPLGGKYSIDLSENATIKTDGAKVIEAGKIQRKTKAALNLFASQVITGSGTGKNLKGMSAHATELGRTLSTTLDLTASMTRDQALIILDEFNRWNAQIDLTGANRIYCSLGVASRLKTVLQILGMYTGNIKVGNVEGLDFFGAMVVPVADAVVNSLDGNTTDIYLARVNTADGVYCALPTGSPIRVSPAKDCGSPIATGWVEIVTQFIPHNSRAFLKVEGAVIKKA